MHACTLELTHTAGWPEPACRKPGRAGESELVRRAQRGDKAAFTELVESSQDRVYRMAYRILRHPEDAEEIAQEAFAKAYFAVKTFDGRSSFFTWVCRIALNECYAALRRKRVKLVFGEECLTAPDRRPGPDQLAAQRDLVNKLLARLPERDRLLIIWKEVEGFSTAQLAEMTGLNENTVKARLLRGRRRLAAIARTLARRRCAGPAGL